MQITKSRLRQIIVEELQKIMERPIGRSKKYKTGLKDLSKLVQDYPPYDPKVPVIGCGTPLTPPCSDVDRSEAADAAWAEANLEPCPPGYVLGSLDAGCVVKDYCPDGTPLIGDKCPPFSYAAMMRKPK